MESPHEKAYHYCGNPPQLWAQNKVIIGHDADHREEYDYWETPVTWRHDRFAHMLIVGQTGSGKTNLFFRCCLLTKELTPINLENE